MKRLLTVLGLITFNSIFAQIDYPESSETVFLKTNEVRLGVVKLLAGNSLEFAYERVVDRNQGYGANILIGFGSDEYSGTNQTFSISPYYRFYFNKSQEYGAKGMFVEGFADFYSGKAYDYSYDYWNSYPGMGHQDYEKSFFDIAAGVALGWKWVNTANFVFEVKAGYGRNLLKENPMEGIFRGDFSIGYRF